MTITPITDEISSLLARVLFRWAEKYGNAYRFTVLGEERVGLLVLVTDLDRG